MQVENNTYFEPRDVHSPCDQAKDMLKAREYVEAMIPILSVF